MGLPFTPPPKTPKTLDASQITWDTVNSLSHGSHRICGPPTVRLLLWGGHHTLYTTRATLGQICSIKVTKSHNTETKSHSLFVLTTVIKAILFMHHFLNYRGFSNMGGQIYGKKIAYNPHPKRQDSPTIKIRSP